MSGVLAVVCLVAAVGLVVASATAARGAALAATFRRVAGQYHGDVEQAGVFGWPAATFSHRDMWVTIRITGAWGLRSTTVEVQAETPIKFLPEGPPPQAPWENPVRRSPLAFSCEIAPAAFWQRMAYLIGTRKPLCESPHFDLNYTIATDDRERARRLLTRYVQIQIDRLRYFQGGNQIRVALCQGTLTVSRQGVIRNERVLRQFVGLVLELYEQAAASAGVGIDILEAPAASAADAVCKVCGDCLADEEIVYCRVCDTPHHRDCWRYFGGCSVYACGERRFNRTPRLAREKA